MNSKGKTLNLFSLVMLTVGSVASMRNLPTIALLGDSLIFFFSLALIFFVLPITLMAAELSATWPEQGGIYIWTKHAFGKKLGFLTVWFQWLGNLIWFPTILSFAAASAGYLISPELVNNKIFIAATVIAIFWGTTCINFFGMRFSARLNNFCTLVGLFLPIVLIISIGVTWFYSGNQMQLHLTTGNFLPNFNNPEMWIALTGMIMSFCGIEIATVHANDVKDPHRTYPIAITISTTLLALLLFLGAISVACIMPKNHINLLAGMMQTFQTFFIAFHLIWIMPAIAIILVLGSIGCINNWIIAPIKGLSIAAGETKHLKHFSKANKHDAPHALLIYQAIIVTLLMLIFIALPSVSASYWLLTTLAAQLFMLMYVLVFTAGILLRFKHPARLRPFKIPGKNHSGMIIVGSIGIIGALLTIAIGFIPPANIQIGSTFRYEVILISGLLITILPPFFIHKKAKEEIEEKIISEM